ncbi:hypothetical protein Efla_006038 [Eimeria flavescens]
MKQPLKQLAHDVASLQQQQLQQAARPRSQLLQRQLQPGPNSLPPAAVGGRGPLDQDPRGPLPEGGTFPFEAQQAATHLPTGAGSCRTLLLQSSYQSCAAVAAAATELCCQKSMCCCCGCSSCCGCNRSSSPCHRRARLAEKFSGAEATAAALSVAAALLLRYLTACCAQSRDAAVDAQQQAESELLQQPAAVAGSLIRFVCFNLSLSGSGSGTIYGFKELALCYEKVKTNNLLRQKP